MAHEPRKKPLDFGGNPDRVTLGYRLGLGAPPYSQVLLSGVHLIINKLRHRRPWCRYALY